jgi:general L-amino acid transport system substrate-binding protein
MLGKFSLAIAGAICGAVMAGTASAGPILDAVRSRGEVRCGMNVSFAGFATPDAKGVWQGMDADFCRGLSAALFGTPDKVKFVPLTASTRFTAVSTGEVDVLFRNSTMTLSRDVTLGIRAITPYFYDGHAFMVRADSNIKKATELDGATMCLLQGTTNELITADYFRDQKMKFQPVVFERAEQVRAALKAGRCDAYGSDSADLANNRLALGNVAEWTILDERFSKEPYGPYVRRGDDEWFDIVRWYVTAMIEAEESGITAENVEKIRDTTTNANLRRLLGVTPELSKALKLDPAWVVNAIKTAGNYGEIYERSFGKSSVFNLPRGQNELWTKGGLLYALPMR